VIERGLLVSILGLDGQVYRGTMGAEPSLPAGNGIRVIRMRRDRELGPWSRRDLFKMIHNDGGIRSTVWVRTWSGL
jgi:hypothetical protein